MRGIIQAYVCLVAMASGALAQTPAETPPPAETATPIPAETAAPVATPDAKALRATGQQQLRLGRYEEALEALLAAYSAAPDHELLLPIARCYRELENWQKAAFYAEEYLENPAAPDRTRAETILTEAREEQQRDREMDRLTVLLGNDEKPVATANPAPESAVIAPPAVPVERTKPSRRGWIWGAAGILAAGALAGGIAAATSSSPEPRKRETLPAGDLGTLDRRTE